MGARPLRSHLPHSQSVGHTGVRFPGAGLKFAPTPLSRLRPDAPPFLVLHGTHDTLVPVEEARRFCDAFRRVVRAPLVYAELPGAQHAFEIFPSLRSTFVIHGVERFLAWVYTRHLLGQRTAARATAQR